MKIDWTRKLTSRKFWIAIVGFVTPLLIGFGMTEAAVSQTTSIIMSCGTLVAYILAEGWADASSAGSSTDKTKTDETEQ